MNTLKNCFSACTQPCMTVGAMAKDEIKLFVFPPEDEINDIKSRPLYLRAQLVQHELTQISRHNMYPSQFCCACLKGKPTQSTVLIEYDAFTDAQGGTISKPEDAVLYVIGRDAGALGDSTWYNPSHVEKYDKKKCGHDQDPRKRLSGLMRFTVNKGDARHCRLEFQYSKSVAGVGGFTRIPVMMQKHEITKDHEFSKLEMNKVMVNVDSASGIPQLTKFDKQDPFCAVFLVIPGVEDWEKAPKKPREMGRTKNAQSASAPVWWESFRFNCSPQSCPQGGKIVFVVQDYPTSKLTGGFSATFMCAGSIDLMELKDKEFTGEIQLTENNPMKPGKNKPNPDQRGKLKIRALWNTGHSNPLL